jgi:hypothetical protein
MLSIREAFQIQVLDASKPGLPFKPGKYISGNVRWPTPLS